MRNHRAVALLAATALTLWNLPGRAAPHAGGFDRPCKPCEDFDRYVNGSWRRTHPVPAGAESFDRFEALGNQNHRRLGQVLERAAAYTGDPGSSSQKLGDFYASCMNTARIDRLGTRPLDGELARIEGIHDRASLAEGIARLHRDGVDALFSLDTFEPGPEMPIRAEVAPTSLAMAEPFYYSRAGSGWRRAFAAHAARVLRLSGVPRRIAEAEAKTIVVIETQLALASSERPTLDPAGDETVALATLLALAPHFDWPRYFRALGLEPLVVSVPRPEYVRGLDLQLARVGIERWKVYLRWRLLDAAAASLSRPMATEDSRFSTHFWDEVPGASRQPFCVDATANALGDLLNRTYIEKYLAPDGIERVGVIFEAIKAQLVRAFEDPGLREQTRAGAMARFDRLVLKLGYPAHWIDYDGLTIDRGAFFANVLQGWQFEVRRKLARIGTMPDPGRWRTDPLEVNAYYDLAANELVLPAGILQPPFFDPRADDAVNYGGIGAVIGHELTHGFSPLEQYSPSGKRQSWWAKVDEERFVRRATCLSRQFDRYGVDGRHVLGESVADLGGLALAYDAFRTAEGLRPQPSPSAEQRFFLSYARLWAANEPYGGDSDYAPSRLRVQIPLSNLESFARAFRCQRDDRLVRSATGRCRIW